MEIWRILTLCFIGTTISWANAQTEMDQSQTNMTNSDMMSTTEGSSMAMMNRSSSSNDTTSMLLDGVITTTMAAKEQVVLIGNSSQPPFLHVDSSASDSSIQTNLSDPSITTATEAMSESPSTESKRVEWTTVMNTSPWVPGKFPPPGISENDGSKNTGSGSSETGSTTMGWNVHEEVSLSNKDKYDMFMAHEPARADESTTNNGMDTTTIAWFLESVATKTKSIQKSDTATWSADQLPKGTGVGSSKELGMDKSAKSSMQKPGGNGVEIARVANPLMAILSIAFFVLSCF